MSDVIELKGRLLLARGFFLKHNIKPETVKGIFKRRFEKLIIDKGIKYLEYGSIPPPTQKELPPLATIKAEIREAVRKEELNQYISSLNFCISKGHIQYISTYKTNYGISYERAVKAAKEHAVWSYVLAVHNSSHCLSELHQAFNEVFPGRYNSKCSFSNAIRKRVKEGIANKAVDQRIFSAPQNVKRVCELNQYWTTGLLSLGRKYSYTKIWEKLFEMCAEAQVKPPSLSWVKKYCKEILRKNNSISTARNGNLEQVTKHLPFASMKQALYANDQWQVDGWTLPFYIGGYQRPVMVIVRDSHSKRVIGSAVGESENTVVIMEAFKEAIITTGCLPFEIVSDNHSFNKTMEAAHFKAEIARIGTHYTITSNPRYKSIIERYNKHLDSLCRDYYGYIGEGIKSKSENAHPKQELLDKYQKNQLQPDEVKLIAISIVEQFNNTASAKTGKSPNELYECSEQPHAFPVSLEERIKILTAKTISKVSRGQITIKRGMQVYDYQFPAALYNQVNGKEVIVRYEDLADGIYVYDLNQDTFIICLTQKPLIHAAMANQDEKDIELLQKNKGRLKGIQVKAKKAMEDLTQSAITAHPDAYALLNKVTTPKNVLQEFEQNALKKRLAQDKGIRLDRVPVPDRESELDNEALKPTAKKVNESPFNVLIQPNEKLTIVNPNDFEDEE